MPCPLFKLIRAYVHDTSGFVISKIDTIIGGTIGIDIGFTQIIIYISQEVTYT